MTLTSREMDTKLKVEKCMIKLNKLVKVNFVCENHFSANPRYFVQGSSDLLNSIGKY